MTNDYTIDTAMVLAAGFGKRLRPLTLTRPKPLVQIGGITMLDRTLAMAAGAGLRRAVVNAHYLADQIIAHCAGDTPLDCVVSDESDAILDTGGGVVNALPLLGDKPFVIMNADTFWIDGPTPALPAMIRAFDPSAMDMLLLLAPVSRTTGHSGSTDFTIDDAGRAHRAAGDPDGFVYAGAMIASPAIFAGETTRSHSLNLYFDRAIANGRLFGHVLHDGHWITVGTPEGLAQAEAKLADLMS
jgi:MurNAc alpha-1-phosphate uridylyltransferase